MNNILSLNALSPNLVASDCKLVSLDNIFTAAYCLVTFADGNKEATTVLN